MTDYLYAKSLGDDPNVKAILQELVHTIQQKPCEVNLGDLVTLRRNLFLGVSHSKTCHTFFWKELLNVGLSVFVFTCFQVLAQTATYLIVITQFYDSK